MTDRSDLASVLRAIAQGSSVDWDAMNAAPANPALAAILAELKILARISEVHGTAETFESTIADGDEEPGSWGPLTILERVGKGSYGVVYRAWDPRLEREVALKLLAPHSAPGREDIPTIEEGRLLAKVRHPNIVTVFGADRIDGRVGIWMEFINGRTLADVVRFDGPVGASEIARVGVEVAQGLAAVHRVGLVHRDVKAQNVVLQDDGRIVLMDFGSGGDLADQGRTAAGTPLYLAPEVLQGGPASPTGDLYSVGVLLFHLATGTFPVRGGTLLELRDAHTASTRAQLRRLRPDLPPRLRAAIERASHPDTKVRYQTATELEAALLDVAHRQWRRVGVAAALLVGVVSVLALGRGASVGRPSAVPASAVSTTDTRASELDPMDTVVAHTAAATDLYRESLFWARRGNWGAAAPSARQAVVADPGFTTGWIWAAWAIRNAALGASSYDIDDNLKRTAERDYLPYVQRALELAPSAPEWERQWILASAAGFRGEDREAIQHLTTLLALTPGHRYAFNNIQHAAGRMIRLAKNRTEAADALALTRRGLPSQRWRQCCRWMEWAPAHVSWRNDEVDQVRSDVDNALQGLRSGSIAPSQLAGYFALAIGRLDDAVTLFLGSDQPGGEAGRQLDLLAAADVRGDEAEIQRLSAPLPRSGPFVSPSRLIRSGLFREAEAFLSSPASLDERWQRRFDVARGQLLGMSGRFDEAIPFLRGGMNALANTDFREYYEACSALAGGYRQRREFLTAVATLEECTARPPLFGQSTGLSFVGATPWMSLRLDLADTYRVVGRVGDAERIEASLRSKLKYADADYPLLSRLDRIPR